MNSPIKSNKKEQLKARLTGSVRENKTIECGLKILEHVGWVIVQTWKPLEKEEENR